MRLAVVTNILTPYRIPLFEAMRSRVDALTVFVMADREENRDWELERYDFKLEILPGFHANPRSHPVSTHWNYGVVSALRRFAPDVVLSGGFAPANVGARLYCLLFGRAFVGWGELSAQDATMASRVRRGVRRWMTSGSAGSIASSTEARGVFLHYGAKPETVLTCVMPIDVDRFSEETRAFRTTQAYRNLRSRYSLPILLVVGRVMREKGFPELFRIYERLLPTWPEASLLIVGDGPDRSRYESDVTAKGWRNVHFVGFQQLAGLCRFLAIADVFVFPTLADPFGAVLSEAMAAGLPVASSLYAAATNDLVEDGVSGFRIDPENTEASVTTIREILAMDSEQRLAVGLAAYLRVKRFDVHASADSMVRFMAGLQKAPRHPIHRHAGCRGSIARER